MPLKHSALSLFVRRQAEGEDCIEALESGA
jgi:hypothetical protein